MTDRELLELAAKAAGIEVSYIGPQGVYARATDCKVWNPLIDGADALRLASRLLIDLQFFPDVGGFVRAWCPPISDWLDEDANGDLAAATRRAVVRAAAEIGRAMP